MVSNNLETQVTRLKIVNSACLPHIEGIAHGGPAVTGLASDRKVSCSIPCLAADFL